MPAVSFIGQSYCHLAANSERIDHSYWRRTPAACVRLTHRGHTAAHRSVAYAASHAETPLQPPSGKVARSSRIKVRDGQDHLRCVCKMHLQSVSVLKFTCIVLMELKSYDSVAVSIGQDFGPVHLR